jgi:hypothetical protein
LDASRTIQVALLPFVIPLGTALIENESTKVVELQSPENGEA